MATCNGGHLILAILIALFVVFLYFFYWKKPTATEAEIANLSKIIALYLKFAQACLDEGFEVPELDSKLVLKFKWAVVLTPFEKTWLNKRAMDYLEDSGMVTRAEDL